jgi:hypothetical protein
MGRPQHEERTDAFLEVAGFLGENDDGQITINDPIDRMEHNLANSEHEAYSYKHMQSKLHEHFGRRIMQAEINGMGIPNFTDQFVQCVADNVDHNIRTLYSHGTFHGMGVIAAITPGTKPSKPVHI